MNISIIVGGRFHAFNLAEQLNINNNLSQLITSYPKMYLKNKYEINPRKIKSIFIKEILTKIKFNKFKFIDDFIIEYFDKKASELIDFEDLDILIGWSSFSLNSFKIAQKFKCLKILERGSTHIEYQNEIVKEEYKIHNLKPVLTSDFVIKKELEEYKIADYITVPTEFAKQTFIDRGINESKLIKIPYGVNINHFDKKSENNQMHNNVSFRIIYTGAVSVRKGVIYLLKAYDGLNLKDSELLIIGNIDKELIPIVKKFRKNKKIKFISSRKQSELYKYYQISDLFVTCSIEEGLSMVQLQAMSSGLPVICTRNSGGEEIIDNNVDGFILPIRDTEILKTKIKYLYENKNILKDMGNEAKKKASNKFSWESYGKNVIQTYQKLLTKR